MALIVEDGTIVANADSWVTLAFVTDHHTKRGNTRWTVGGVSDATREQCIIRAVDYIDKRFGAWFRGRKYSSQQTLSWPRAGARDNSGFLLNAVIPIQLKRATAEYALRALIYNVLAPDAPLPVPTQSQVDGASSGTTSASGAVKSLSQKVGPIEETVSYATADEQNSNRSTGTTQVDDWVIPTYPEADLWLEELMDDLMSNAFGRG
jgi:hypothetical protein